MCGGVFWGWFWGHGVGVCGFWGERGGNGGGIFVGGGELEKGRRGEDVNISMEKQLEQIPVNPQPLTMSSLSRLLGNRSL